MPDAAEPAGATACLDCGAEVAPGLLSCPGCHRLVHAARLKQLADEARRADSPTAALVAWRSALELLPPGTRQHEAVSARIAELGRQVDASARAPSPPTTSGDPEGRKGLAGATGLAGTLALLAWKFKFAAVFVLTKGKLLLLGLTKASTFLSMAVTVGLYATLFGWRFALGIVVSIYIHEMGHVAALLRYGIKASAPLFIPGLGAVIRLRQSLGDPRQDARVGLAGPIWGLGAALAAYGIGLALDSPVWAAIAHFGAWVNLFNLLPIWQLDGGRAFHALSRRQRWLAALVIAVAWSLTSEGLLILILIVAAINAASAPAPSEPDPGALLQYSALVAILSALTQIHVAVPPGR
jgi:Zn-dependent protease